MGTKKILFPLEMCNGEKAHTLEELREKFNVGKVLEYAGSGQLARWLRDRGAAEIVAKIEALDKTSERYAEGVCEAILGAVSGEVLNQIEEAKLRKAEAEKAAAEQMKLEAEKAAAEQMKLEAEKAAAEQLRIEEERKKEEERKQQPPTLLVNKEGIYVVEGNRLIHRKICAKDNNAHDDFSDMHGVVQEGKDIYYIKTVWHSMFDMEYFLCRIDANTGDETRICKMKEAFRLLGIRNHKMFYCRLWMTKEHTEILELDLGSMVEKSHNLRLNSMPIPNALARENLYLADTLEYPCIDKDGVHIYCRMEAKGVGKAHIADFDLENDSVKKLFDLEKAFIWHPIGWTGGHDWGMGSQGFVVRDITPHQSENKGKCTYYNTITKEIRQLPQLADGIFSICRKYRNGMLNLMCCEESKIYILIASALTFPDQHPERLILVEYDMDTAGITEKINMDKGCFYSSFKDGVKEILVSNGYLYMNHFSNFQSWRFSLENWKAERLAKDGSEYKYVAV